MDSHRAAACRGRAARPPLSAPPRVATQYGAFSAAAGFHAETPQQYLSSTVMPRLMRALSALEAARPANALDFIADFLDRPDETEDKVYWPDIRVSENAHKVLARSAASASFGSKNSSVRDRSSCTISSGRA